MPRKTKIKTVAILNVPDFKDDNGYWFKSASTVHEKVIYQYRTRAWCLWSGIENRTGDAKHIHTKRPNYLGAKNLFGDFQAMAEWCQTQFGYMKRDHKGFFWHLDKDLLVPGNKAYGPDTCLFVPNHINNLLQPGNPRSVSLGLPTGVTTDDRRVGYIAQCKVHYKNTAWVGSFSTPEEAHRAWQETKIGEILYHSQRDELGEKLQGVLLKHAATIQEDLDNGTQTVLRVVA